MYQIKATLPLKIKIRNQHTEFSIKHKRTNFENRKDAFQKYF